ncbi:hypothetical protein [Cytobacillus oceanisediminis]|uniref:hypothetical protein n=1 Tax=Cytobacillus oceanisediminis TaxID=665099 RepID=UPI0020C886BE|nr:hypothetical protein [Cytobacillus oceanisediminis]
MSIRLAEAKDMNQLIKMRWDNSIEFDETNNVGIDAVLCSSIKSTSSHLTNGHAQSLQSHVLS